MNTSLETVALKLSGHPLLPREFIIRQLEGIQKSRYKLPIFYNTKGLLFPPRLNMEQCSSETTAAYKASMVSGKVIIDLTGGFGIDSLFFSKNIEMVAYIEQNKELFDIAKWNFEKLGISNITFHNGDAIQYITNSKTQPNSIDTIIYIDPARRDSNNKKIFQLADCEPDVTQNLPLFFEKASHILIKTSPMLDINLAVKELKHVAEIHIVAVDNECKEVLYYLHKNHMGEPGIKTINLSPTKIQTFNFSISDEIQATVSYSQPLHYLYEPNVAVLKAGAFKSVSTIHALNKLAPNTHLYTSGMLVRDFPGKIFEIQGLYKFKDKAIFTVLQDRKANIVARNFPYSVDEIKNQMKLKDGGNWFLFAARDREDKPIMILASKLSET